MSPLKDKTIVLGVSGGIAAYKAAELVRLLVTREAQVRVMMTRNACEFITPLTLQTLSANPVATETFNLTQESEIGHIRLADGADAIVIAPATADLIAKAAVGIADDLVTTVLLAARCPIAMRGLWPADGRARAVCAIQRSWLKSWSASCPRRIWPPSES
jgi:phosphopantothenoylcysteine decarboxylase/phosphopantothenate--cysteine ligase